jgi:beta-xylosidase
VGQLWLGWFLGHDAESLRGDVAAIQEAVREASPFGIGRWCTTRASVNTVLTFTGALIYKFTWAQAGSKLSARTGHPNQRGKT